MMTFDVPSVQCSRRNTIFLYSFLNEFSIDAMNVWKSVVNSVFFIFVFIVHRCDRKLISWHTDSLSLRRWKIQPHSCTNCTIAMLQKCRDKREKNRYTDCLECLLRLHVDAIYEWMTTKTKEKTCQNADSSKCIDVRIVEKEM